LNIDGDISFLSRLRCLRRNISRRSLARRGAFYQLAACGQPNAGDRIGEVGKPAWRRNPMDQRIESFLADVLALAGEVEGDSILYDSSGSRGWESHRCLHRGHRAVQGGQLQPQLAKLDEPVDGPQEMVSRNVPFLFDLPMSHHDSQSCLSQRLNQRTSCVATADFFKTIGPKRRFTAMQRYVRSWNTSRHGADIVSVPACRAAALR